MSFHFHNLDLFGLNIKRWIKVKSLVKILLHGRTDSFKTLLQALTDVQGKSIGFYYEKII